MNHVWRLVLDEAAFQFVLSRRRQRERLVLLKAFESLRADPSRKPDFEIADASGRPLSVRRARPFLITYWLDASINEIRIVELELVAAP